MPCIRGSSLLKMGCQHFNLTLGGPTPGHSHPQDSFYALLKLSCFLLFFLFFFLSWKRRKHRFFTTQVLSAKHKLIQPPKSGCQNLYSTLGGSTPGFFFTPIFLLFFVKTKFFSRYCLELLGNVCTEIRFSTYKLLYPAFG